MQCVVHVVEQIAQVVALQRHLLRRCGLLRYRGKPVSYRVEQFRVHFAPPLGATYADLFVLRSRPADADRPLIEGKFKSTHNVSDRVAKLMTSTFYALLPLADLEAATSEVAADEGKAAPPPLAPPVQTEPKPEEEERAPKGRTRTGGGANLHYNIQIHVPSTKDIEVYNAIFKSIKEHLIE